MNVDIFACINFRGFMKMDNFRGFMKMGNFPRIKIRVLCTIGSLG